MRFFVTDGNVDHHRGAKDRKKSSTELLGADRLGSPVFREIRNRTALIRMWQKMREDYLGGIP